MVVRCFSCVIGSALVALWACMFIRSESVGGEPQAGRSSSPNEASRAREGVKLAYPPLKKGEKIDPESLSRLIGERVAAFESKIPEAVRSDVPREYGWEAMIRRVPIGVSTLLRTRDLPGPGPEAPPNDPRVISFERQPAIERIVFTNNLLAVRFLEVGVTMARPVARVAFRYADLPAAGLGTGFMVSRSLFMTNNHVIPDTDMAKKLVAQFNYQYARDGITLLQPENYEFDPDDFMYTDQDLDFTLIRIKPRSNVPSGTGGPVALIQAGDEFGFIPLTTSFFYSKGQQANVVQHPQGRPKEIALQQNEIQAIYGKVIRYTSDTEPGSSGSPVFNNSWTLITLHHSAGDQDQKTGEWLNNEGVRIDKIIEHIKQKMKPDIVKEMGL